MGVAGPQGALAIGQNLLVQVNGLLGSARRPVGTGEVTPRDQGVEVVGSQDALAVGQVPLEQGDDLVDPAEIVPLLYLYILRLH